MAIITAIQQKKRPIYEAIVVPETVNLTWIRDRNVVAIEERQIFPHESEYNNWAISMKRYIRSRRGKLLEFLSYDEFCKMLRDNKKACVLTFRVGKSFYRVFVD